MLRKKSSVYDEKLVQINLRMGTHFSCYLNGNLFYEIKVKEKYVNDFKKMWNDQKNILISFDKTSHALIYFLSLLDEKWILSNLAPLTSRDPISIVCKYLKDGSLDDGIKVKDTLQEALQGINTISDAQLVSLISRNLYFENRRDTFCLLQDNFNFHIAPKERYVSLCNLVRDKYGIGHADPVTLDDFVYKASFAFLRSFRSLQTVRNSRLNEIAYLSNSSTQFMAAVEKLHGEFEQENKYFVYRKDGYVAIFNGTLSRPRMQIFALSYNVSLHGYRPSPMGIQKLYVVKNNEFWNEIHYEFARKHEETSENTEAIIKSSDRYHMTLREIQRTLKTDYGVSITESAIGITVKRALRKIEEKLDKIGIDEGDYLKVAYQ